VLLRPAPDPQTRCVGAADLPCGGTWRIIPSADRPTRVARLTSPGGEAGCSGQLGNSGYIRSSPTLALVLAEEGAIATNLADADRGSCTLAMPSDLVRGSDSPESAEREIAVWFADVLV